MILRRIKFVCIAFILISGCAHLPRTEQTLAQAQKLGFVKQQHTTQSFKLTTLSRISKPNEPLVVYLEGDGHSMASKFKLSKNPTPYQPLALELAMQDPRPNVIYIARPCQYTPIKDDKYCHPRYWSTHRYAQEVIDSTIEVLHRFRANQRSNDVHLIGFSGGGGLAALISAHEKNVKTLITVAGNLNTTMMDNIHQTTPQIGSLNPVDFAGGVNIPQHHFAGGDDKTVPASVIQSFVNITKGPCTQFSIQPDFGHQKGWKENWPALLKQMPCQNEAANV